MFKNKYLCGFGDPQQAKGEKRQRSKMVRDVPFLYGISG